MFYWVAGVACERMALPPWCKHCEPWRPGMHDVVGDRALARVTAAATGASKRESSCSSSALHTSGLVAALASVRCRHFPNNVRTVFTARKYRRCDRAAALVPRARLCFSGSLEEFDCRG